MGSIGIISLLRLGEIEDFIQFCRNYPVVKVRPVPRDVSRAGQTKVEPSSSDPLVGGPPRRRRDTDQGFGIRDMVPVVDCGMSSGMGPDLFRCWRRGLAGGGGDEETRTP